MSQVILDIGLDKRGKDQGDIKCTPKEEGDPQEYTKYEYTKKSNGGSFSLFFLYYDEQPLRGILPYPISVTSVFTYFKKSGDELLLIDIALSSGIYWYCINPDTDVNVEENTFTRFMVEKTKVLDTGEIRNILENINENHGFNLLQLSISQSKTVQKLVSSSDIIFDLTKTKIGYSSECSGTNISVIPGKVGTYQKVQHFSSSSTFFIRGIKLDGSQYMKVKGGLPNEGLTEFNVYYKDTNYTTPLLVELKAESQSIDGGSYFPSKYLLSKNTKDGGDKKWDIRKIGSYVGDQLEKVLQNIDKHEKLDLNNLGYSDLKSKLGDISKGVTIDITRTFEQTGDNGTKHYDSDGVRIPYKTLSSSGYYVVRQPYFPSFILKNIKTSQSMEISEDQLPPLGTEIWKLNVYCKSDSYKEPVLIEVIGKYEQSDGCPKYAYYYSLDNGQWKGYLLSTQFKNVGGIRERGGEDITDLTKVISHVRGEGDKIDLERLDEELKNKLTKYTPEASVDRKGGITFYLTKKPKGTSGRSYQTTYYSSRKIITVKLVDKTSLPEYRRVKHELPPGSKSFSIKGIKLPDKWNIEVNGGFPSETFTNFFAYYGKDDSGYNTPLLITLTINSTEEDQDSEDDNPDRYILVKSKDNKKWDVYRAKDMNENDDENGDLTKILANISQGNFDFKDIKRKLKAKLTKYHPDSGKASSQEDGSENPVYKTVLEGLGGSGATGGAVWEGYNLLLNPDRSLIARIIRIFRLLI